MNRITNRIVISFLTAVLIFMHPKMFMRPLGKNIILGWNFENTTGLSGTF